MAELILSTTIIPLAFAIFSARRLLTYLHAYQQEEYNSGRFLTWIYKNRVFDRRLSVTLLLFSIPVMVFSSKVWLAQSLIIVIFLFFAIREKDPRKFSKKKLVMTSRAKRIYFIALLFAVSMTAGDIFSPVPIFWAIPVQLIPLTLIAANFVLKPYEDHVRQKYMLEARQKLEKVNPVIVAITGSYGKTSVKHILAHILKSAAPALVTHGSINTAMGVTRIIREQLEKRHKYLVTEMGAYGPGSVKRLCELTPPDIGIITAIGHSHYERFRSLETVAEAKYELAEAAIEKNGHIVAHLDTLGYHKSMAIYQENSERFTIVVPYNTENHTGQKPDFAVSPAPANSLHIKRIEQTDKGLAVTVICQDREYNLEAPLFGIHHGINMAIAFAAAWTLELPEKHIVTALKTTPQIDHRLEVKAYGNGGLLIDDAFNSNPDGFHHALDLLESISRGRRKILITPGMVELGEAHEEKHAEAGKYAALKADIVLAVCPERIKSFTEACRNNSSGERKLYEIGSFAEAQEWLAQNGREDDVILLENDLPDIYENVPRL
jgi:UDP-N-acetylmuramoyl-tripeptide--D-alanyl-D-alanine ligase